MSWGDLSAYLFWSGLRPMTELEFEKACRGTIAPVANGYPWGTTGIASSAYTLANAGATNEGIATNFSTTVGNANYTPTVGTINSPVRGGIFAANSNNSGRVTAGASYYGIMELGGNLWERTVVTDNGQGGYYDGSNGTGDLAANGDIDNVFWISVTSPDGSGFRGGSWASPPGYLQVSGRTSAINPASGRANDYGGRGVRTAP